MLPQKNQDAVKDYSEDRNHRIFSHPVQQRDRVISLFESVRTRCSVYGSQERVRMNCVRLDLLMEGNSLAGTTVAVVVVDAESASSLSNANNDGQTTYSA